jgi:hypothetical protein
MAAPLPRGLQDHETAVVISLYPGFGSLVLRALLAANARRVAVVCRNDVPELRDAAGQRALAQLIGPKYRITRLLRSTPGPDMAVILAEQTPATGLTAADQVAAFIYGRPHGKVGNAWREGLISLRKSQGQVLTKRDARRAIESVWPRVDVLDRGLLDLPRHLFPALLEAVRRSAEECAADAPAAGGLS